MIILDTLLVGGIQFVLGKIAAAVDAELSDDRVWREELLAAQMRLELGEISEREYAALEGDLLARIREVRERQREPGPSPAAFRVTGIDVSAAGDDTEDERRGIDLPPR